jgi:hypothetical protein
MVDLAAGFEPVAASRSSATDPSGTPAHCLDDRRRYLIEHQPTFRS